MWTDGKKPPSHGWPWAWPVSLWVSWVRVCNSHGGSASEQASAARGCPFAGRDQHCDPLRTDQCFCRLLLALRAPATPGSVLGECIAALLRRWIRPQRKLHWRGAESGRLRTCIDSGEAATRFPSAVSSRVCPVVNAIEIWVNAATIGCLGNQKKGINQAPPISLRSTSPPATTRCT